MPTSDLITNAVRRITNRPPELTYSPGLAFGDAAGGAVLVRIDEYGVRGKPRPYPLRPTPGVRARVRRGARVFVAQQGSPQAFVVPCFSADVRAEEVAT